MTIERGRWLLAAALPTTGVTPASAEEASGDPGVQSGTPELADLTSHSAENLMWGGELQWGDRENDSGRRRLPRQHGAEFLVRTDGDTCVISLCRTKNKKPNRRCVLGTESSS